MNSDNGLLKRVEVYKSGVLTYWRNMEYDPAAWRMTQVTTPEGRILYRYNEYGQLTGMRTSLGREVDYVYDALGRLIAVKSAGFSSDQSAQSAVKTVRYEYDSAGRRSKTVNPNGTEVNYNYDNADGSLKEIVHKNATANLLKLTYMRDRRGTILGVVEERAGQANVTWTYAYDSATRLRSAKRVVTGGTTRTYAYTYDGAGNRLTQSINGVTTNYTYNAFGQLTGDGTKTYQYDAYGNLEWEKTAGENSHPVRRYWWDGENHLTKVDLKYGGEWRGHKPISGSRNARPQSNQIRSHPYIVPNE